MTPLMSGYDANHAQIVGGGGTMGNNGVGGGGGAMQQGPSDPVELRRINFQVS